jgi:hypothetical protein
MYGHEFEHLHFPKKGSEILAKVKEKNEALVTKIAAREKRIETIVKEKGLTAADFFQNIDRFAGRTSGDFDNAQGFSAAEQAALGTEANKLKDDRREAVKLTLIANNLPVDEVFNLSFDELSYFDF